jgi:poly-gamma-glutamate capsule biosynthesis protein CapA/YwtB (metallophosphatase superfamily)
MNPTHRLTIFALLLIIAQPCLGQVTISGRVLSESGGAVPGAVVQIGRAEAAADTAGRFTLSADPAEIYMLSYSAENHFPMVHSYSPLEFAWQQETSSGETIVVPDVTLVERTQGRVMLAFGGDAMMGRRFSKPAEGEPVLIRDGHKAEDTIALLRHIRPYLELADFASVNLETQVMADKPAQNAPKSYVFYTPPESLFALKTAGIDYVTLGNNHIYDYLAAGLESTIEALNASGLAWSGAGVNESQSLLPYRVRIGENPMSFLGFLGWAGNFSPNQVAQGVDKGGAAFGTIENIRKAVGNETKQGYLPVVQYHGSREYTDEPTLVTESRLKQAIDDGAVLAIGHHPHVVQGFEIYQGKLIAYSMGNFMFDQFHYATKRSYLLYVWLDHDRLHRAEVMPLRIKGYLPVPATDSFRQSILKRVNELSSRRGLVLQTSGGNAVINPRAQQLQTPATSILTSPHKSRPPESTVWRLENRAWNQPVGSVTADPQNPARMRLGQNLLPMGHLESHYLFDAPDRSWIASGTQTIVTTDNAPSGKNVMQLVVPAGREQGTIGMRTFEYTFEPGTPSSFVLAARTDAPANVTAYQQWRKKDENRLEALETAKLRIIGQQQLSAGDWQELRFDFDSPRVTAISYRVVLKVTPLDASKDHYSWFDDIALVEWLSPPLNDGDVPAHVANKLASHAGFVTNKAFIPVQE